MSNLTEPILNEVEVDYFRRHGYIVRTDLLTDEERDEFIALFDRDRESIQISLASLWLPPADQLRRARHHAQI